MNALRCLFVNGLKAQFQPDRFPGSDLKTSEHLNHFRRQAVRSCADIQGDDLRTLKCFCKERAEPFNISVSVGVGLEIGDIAPVLRRNGSRDLGIHSLFGFFNLFSDGKKRRGKISGAALGAEGAAAGAQGPVPARTAAAALQGKAVYFGAEAGAHGVVKGEIVHGGGLSCETAVAVWCGTEGGSCAGFCGRTSRFHHNIKRNGK